MITKAQWIAMHRHDIPVNGDWSGFAGVAHGGYHGHIPTRAVIDHLARVLGEPDDEPRATNR